MAGADEAGRGCLAGPLVAAAVLFDLEGLSRRSRLALSGLDDSKRLGRAERERLGAAILLHAAEVSVIMVAPSRIDAIGLHVANIDALRRALGNLRRRYDQAWVDGFALGGDAPPHQRLVGGDRRSAAVAAAGVIAKTTRDRLMRGAVADEHPGYGFETHVGYGTAEHLRALAELGPSPAHRRCFRPVAFTELSLFAPDDAAR